MSSTTTIKRRAKKACIGCRARKVRCDVTRTGTPCTNCQLDTKTCLVKERITNRASTRRPGLQHVFDSSKFDVPATSTRSCKPTAICSSTAEELINSDSVLEMNVPDCAHLPLSVASDNGKAQASAVMPLFSPEMSPSLIINQQSSNFRSRSLERREPVSPLSLKRDAFTSMVTSVPYRSHKFMTIGNAPSLTAQDLAFLEAKGALHIPERPLLDEFMRQYFLHVHPMLPLIDEGDFWDTYHQTDATKSMPLLLLQAMVFASCTCVADSVVRSLGYNSIRAARSSFYHKTKLLFDMGTEKGPLVLSQAALLMTLWCSAESESTYANSTWLRIGIQHARFIDAHRAWDLTSPSIITDLPEPRPDVRLLKRLWGCCVVRDCFLSVGIARDTQIATAYSPLNVLDFEEEIDRSEVNDTPTKLLLAIIFTRCTHLCSILSEAFRYIWHYDDHRRPASIDFGMFAKCRLKMQAWLKQTELAIQEGEKDNFIRKHCVIVHTNQLFLFYYGCLSFLSRQELLHCFASPEASLALPSDPGLCEEMQNAVLGTVMCFEELTQLDLARYCQASAMAFISIPLLFYILETKFFHPKTHDLGQHARQTRLQALINAIKECRPRYEGAEWVSFTLRYVVDMVECAPPAGSPTSWTDLLAQTPSYCLILIFTVDLSLKQVKIPQDHDFPAVLQGVFRPGLSLNQSPRLKEARAGGNCNYVAANSLGGNTGAINTDGYYGFLAAEHGDTLRTESMENHRPGNALSIVNTTNSNAIDAILQDLYPEFLETPGIDNQAIEVAIPDHPNNTGYLEQSFETPFDKAPDLDGMSLDLDGMPLDLDSALDESGLLELLL